MRVLLVCQDTGVNVGWSFRRLLPELGHQVECFNEEDYFGKLSHSLWRKGFKKIAGVPPAYRRFNRDLRRLAHMFRPTLALFLKGAFVAPETLAFIRNQTGARLVNYCLDDIFSLNPKRVTAQMRASITLWDLIVTSKRYNVPELLAAGAKKAVFVMCGYDPLVHQPVSLAPAEKARWTSDVLFVGTYEKDRAAWLEYLVAHWSGKLRVYGNYWQAVPARSPLFSHIQGRPLYGEEKGRAMTGTKIALGFLCKANRDTYTDRSFEIPACGVFMLAERSNEHLRLYEEGREIACFSSPDELVRQVNYYLAHDSERKAMADAGYRRVMRDGHTYKDRLKEILDLAVQL